MIKQFFKVTLNPIKQSQERKIRLHRGRNESLYLRTSRKKSLQQKIQAISKANQNIFKIKAMQITNRKFLQKMKSADQKTFKLPQLIRKKSPQSYVVPNEHPRIPLRSLQTTESSKMYFQTRNFRSRIVVPTVSKFKTFYPNILPKTNLQEFSLHSQSEKIESSVTQALWKTRNMLVCIKPLKIKGESLINLRHKNFLKLYATLEISQQTYVITGQQAKFSLKNLIEEFGPLQQIIAIKIIKQIVAGVQQLHYHKVYHNNLSLQNIYYDNEGNVTIDISSFDPQGRIQTLQSYISNYSANSPIAHCKSVFADSNYGVFINYYNPPETLIPTTSRLYHMNKDVWAIGCIALELLHNTIDKRNKYHPYNFTTDQVLKHNISNESAKLIQQINQEFEPIDYSQESQTMGKKYTLSEKAQQFVKNCLVVSSEERPQIWEIGKLPFLRL